MLAQRRKAAKEEAGGRCSPKGAREEEKGKEEGEEE